MSELINAVKGHALSVAEFFTPVLKESKFKETGVITPEEFVVAGDHLVHHCPSWQWASGDSRSTKPYLPKDKQLLITKNVPCYKRCKEIEYTESHEKVIETDGNDDGWVDTHHYANLNEKITEMKLDDGRMMTQPVSLTSGPYKRPNDTQRDADYDDETDDEDDDEEAADMDSFMAGGGAIEEDDDAADGYDECNVNRSSNDDKKKPEEEDAEEKIVPTRTYDLNITYDKYYQTPRLWLTGYDEQQIPLSIEQMYEDISQDHAKKTVTMETHPHIPGGPVASVHPCRHAEVMKKIIETVEQGGGELAVHSYLIIFLKFVQAVIPTIEYDYTQNFTM